MLTTIDNLYHVIATELVRSGLTEAYLLGNGHLTSSLQTPETRRVLEIACDAALVQTADAALAKHYHLCEGLQGNPAFMDGSAGYLRVGGTAVHVAVRRVGEVAYRVLFTQLDALALAVDVQAQLATLRERVEALEAVQRTAAGAALARG